MAATNVPWRMWLTGGLQELGFLPLGWPHGPGPLSSSTEAV